MTTTTKEEGVKTGETRRIMKNAIMISVAFMLHFTAYSGAANLQSSINAEAGLGMVSLAAVYAGLVASNLFLPVVIIKWLGCKWAMSVSLISYMPYIGAQLWPRFSTLVPTGLLVGLGGGPLWCAKCTYLTVIAEAHSRLSGTPADVVLVRLFGLFFMILQLCQVWGNLISSLVLSSGDNVFAVSSINASVVAEVCGAAFLPSTDSADTLPTQPPDKIRTIAGAYLACMVAAALTIAVTVDSLSRYNADRTGSSSGLSGWPLLAITLKLMKEPNQLLITLITVWIGLEQAFFGADFTAAFVSCPIGTGWVGYVMMTFGIANALACLVTGYLLKVTGRVSLVCFATILHVALLVTLLAWRPKSQDTIVQYAIATLWGICDSVWMVQINAYCGILFPRREEAAYSNFRLWESLGFIIAYIYSPYLRTSVKIYILLVLLIIGFTCYILVEYKEAHVKKKVIGKNREVYCVKGFDNVAFQNVE